MLYEIRFHGRGGQGAVTASEVLAIAAINEGKYAQAFPTFGAERRGAPVLAFARISDHPITLRCQIYNPDVVVVLDPTLIATENVTRGLKADGLVVINSKLGPDELREKLKLTPKHTLAVVDATTIALEELGLPIVNTAILGALVKATQVVKVESVNEVLKQRFSGKIAEGNVKAVNRAYEEVEIYRGE